MFHGLGNGEFLRRQDELQAQISAEQARRAALTAAELEAERQRKLEFDAYIRLLNANTLRFNVANPATLPLTAFEEQFRQASIAADFNRMNYLMPFTIHRWNAATPLGKYRFSIINGQKQYLPFSEADIRRFLGGPWMTLNRYGFASMIEPRAACDIEHTATLFIEGQKGSTQYYPPAAWQHVFPIYPGLYICQVYKGSAWIRWRGAVWTAVAIVAAVYLGPIIGEKIAGAATSTSTAEAGATGIVGAGTKAGTVTAVTTKATTAAAITTKAGAVAATAAETTTWFAAVKEGTAGLLEYVNKARTIEAVAKGELPPPPISIIGDTFTEWAMGVAKEQMIKEAQERAMQLGVEYLERKMTEKEEAKLRAEIQAMQAELARLMPANVSATPNPNVPAEIQAKSAELALREKQVQDSILAALAIAVPVGLLYFS